MGRRIRPLCSLLVSLFAFMTAVLPGNAFAEGGSYPGLLAIVRKGDLWLYEAGHSPARLTIDGKNSRPAWSADGRWLAFFKGQELWVIGRDGERGTKIAGGVDRMAWSAQGVQLAYATDREVWVMHLAEPVLKAVRIWRSDRRVSDLAWQPRTNRLAVALMGRPEDGQEGAIHLIDPQGTARALVTGRRAACPGYPGGLNWSHEGHHLSFFWHTCSASINADGVTLRVIDESGRPVRIPVGTMLGYRDWVSWNPFEGPSTCLAAVEGAGRQAFRGKRLVVACIGDRESATVTTAGSADLDPSYAPDGSRLAFSRGNEATGDGEDISASPPRWVVVRCLGQLQCKFTFPTGEPGSHDFAPRWDPAGRGVLWYRHKGNTASLWWARFDGSGARQIAGGVDVPASYYGHFDVGEVVAWTR